MLQPLNGTEAFAHQYSVKISVTGINVEALSQAFLLFAAWLNVIPMDEKRLLPFYNRYSAACALAYIIPIFFFFQNEKFAQLWLLYAGNCCYGLLLLISGIFVNKKLHSGASLRSLIIPGLKVIASSIVIICIVLTILGLVFKNKVVQNAPTNYNGLFFGLATNAIIVNFLLGSLTVFLGAVTIKTNQRNEKGEEIT